MGMTYRPRAVWFSMASAAALALALPAAAEEAAAPGQERAPFELEAVIVTAQKRSEDIREVAASVTALTGDDMQRLGVENLEAFAAFVPGLSTVSSAPGLTQITLRGITTGAQQSTATVATYVDDVPYGVSTGHALSSLAVPNVDTFDLARIETLRGPQGTLYGASSMGGLLKYVTAAPRTDRFESKLQAEVADVSGGKTDYSVRGMFNAPLLEDRAAFRASAYYNSDSGYIDNARTGDRDENTFRAAGGRASLLFEPTGDLSIRLSALYEDQKIGGAPSEYVTGLTLEPVYGDLKSYYYVPAHSRQKIGVYSLTADWNLGWADLVSVTGYMDRDIDLRVDATATLGVAVRGLAQMLGVPLTQVPVVTTSSQGRTKKFTQEVRLSSPEGQKFHWLGGLFYTDEDTDTAISLDVSTDELQLPDLLARLYKLSGPAPFKEFAAFATVGYQFTERFDVEAGVRWSRNEQEFEQFGEGLLGGNPHYSQSSDDSSATFRIAPRWRVNDDTTVYGTISSGYRPGGPNVDPSAGLGGYAVPATFGPDSLTNYEVGVKSMLLDRRLEVELSVFYIDWRDIQLGAVAGDVSYVANAGKAHSTGVEFSTRLVPLDGLTLGWSGAYTDAELRENAPGLGALKGDRLASVPKWQTTLTADYEFPLSGDWSASVGGSWQYVGERNTGYSQSYLTGSPSLRLPDYDVASLRARVANETWAAELFANNIFDTRGFTSASYQADLTHALASIIRPRTVGVRLTALF